MRALFSVLAGMAVLFVTGPAFASDVEVKGPHICCKQCVKVIGGILAKVDGVSDAKCDIEGKTVSFKATDEKAAQAGVKAIFDAGFYGAASNDGKALKIGGGVGKKGDKLDKVTLNGVHACCGQCKNAIKGLFKGSTISYGDGKGPQYEVTIEGGELYASSVLQALRKAGFNGTVKK